jgi:hypothetical protein
MLERIEGNGGISTAHGRVVELVHEFVAGALAKAHLSLPAP